MERKRRGKRRNKTEEERSLRVWTRMRERRKRARRKKREVGHWSGEGKEEGCGRF